MLNLTLIPLSRLSSSLFLCIIIYAGLIDNWKTKANAPARRKVVNSKTVLDIVSTFFSSFAPKRLFRELRADYGSSKPVLHDLRFVCFLLITFAQSVRVSSVIAGSEFPESHSTLWTLTSEASSYSWDLLYFLVGFYLAFQTNGLLKVLGSDDPEDPYQLHRQNCHHFLLILGVQLIRWVVDLNVIYSSIDNSFSFLYRLLLPLIIIISLAQLTGSIIEDWTVFDVPSVDHETCFRNGWKNLLFLDQFCPLTHRVSGKILPLRQIFKDSLLPFQCAPWTWFISVEMYCCTLIILIILLTRRTPHFGMIVCSSFFICSLLLSIFLSKRPMSTSELEKDIREFNNVHDSPWIFIGPFLIGRYTGELCFQTNCKPRIGETIGILGWILAFLILAIIVSGRIAFGYFDDFQAVDVGFKGLSHSLFCINIAWVVIHKIRSSNLKWRWTRGFSKLSMTCILVHPILCRVFIILMGSNSIPNANVLIIIVIHIGLVICSLIVAAGIFVIFEAPFCVFKKKYVQKFILRRF